MMNDYSRALLVALILPTPLLAQARHQVLDQTGSPVLITSYSAEFQESDRYSREGIRHQVEYSNRSDRTVMAIQFGLLAFNIFNEFLDRTGGITIEDVAPGRDDSGAWLASALADFSFYTGVAYVAKVRFSDGEIWEADLDDIAVQVRAIESDFDAANLTSRRGASGG